MYLNATCNQFPAMQNLHVNLEQKYIFCPHLRHKLKKPDYSIIVTEHNNMNTNVGHAYETHASTALVHDSDDVHDHEAMSLQLTAGEVVCDRSEDYIDNVCLALKYTCM